MKYLKHLVLLCVIGIVAVGILTTFGKKSSQVFSTINSGLTGGYDAPSEGYARSAPYRDVAFAPPHATAPTMPVVRSEEKVAEPAVAGKMGDMGDGEREAGDIVTNSSSSGESAPLKRMPQSRSSPLKAGERDDNELFEEYLEYLETYQGTPARTVDVRERYIITVLNNNQQPLLDAYVRIYDGNQQVFEGRTYAGGKTIFLPNALNVSTNASEFRLVAEQGNATAETTFKRRTQDRIEIAINGAKPEETLKLDVLFLLDTTGSMGDELSRIQETIDSIAQRIDQLTPRPTLRFGLVAYRDRGDTYVTRLYDFVSDVATFRTLLNSLSADGGGDTPESLNEALHTAVQGVHWADKAVRLTFLVADAGPHLDYEQDFDYIQETQRAVASGIKIYPIAASNTDEYAEYVFRQLAQQTLSRFIFLTYQPGQSSGAPGESTSLQAGDQPYTVDKLDDLIVQVVQRELAAAKGVE